MKIIKVEECTNCSHLNKIKNLEGLATCSEPNLPAELVDKIFCWNNKEVSVWCPLEKLGK